MSMSSVQSYSVQTTGRPDMNLATESKRILYVLDKTISRAKFVGVLKTLVSDDGYILNNVINSEDHFYIMQICRKYEFTGIKFSHKKDSLLGSVEPKSESKARGNVGLSQASAGGESIISDEDEESTSSSESMVQKGIKPMKIPTRVDNELSKVILLLEEYPKVHQLVSEIENEVKLKGRKVLTVSGPCFLMTGYAQISPQMRFFIRCLKELRDGVALHLGESAAQEKAREAYLRECYIKNDKATKEIERLEKELKEHKTDANYCIIGRNVLINRHQNKINKIKKASTEAIEKRVKESERAMANDWKASTAIQEALKEELQITRQKFDNLLKDNLLTEKNLRAKRTKVENQLLGWLQKFDQDIGEKQAEEEEIQQLLDEQNFELQKIRLKLEEQEEEYDELMQERAEYELEMLERRLYIFILNRSARRIQRYFRLYKAKKLARKKARKERKGKKAGKKA